MGLVERVIEAVIALFIIILFATTIFPALGKATGQDITWVILLLIIAAIAVVASLFKR